MIEYFINYHEKLEKAVLEHLYLVILSLTISILIAALITLLTAGFKRLNAPLVHIFEMVYCIPSLALFAIMIPLTGLGTTTAVTVLVFYNQYLLLRNFLDGLNNVDSTVTEAAAGIGMSEWQILFVIRIPLAKRAFFAGIHLAAVSTIGISTIAATINAGGLGSVLFDGLRTLNTAKIVWGSLLAAGLAILVNSILSFVEKRL